MAEGDNRAIIDAICAVTTDEQALELAEWYAMKPRGRAATFLDYYLAGRGGEREVDLEALLNEDGGVRAKVKDTVWPAVRRGVTSGTVPIPQSTYHDRDWQFALGGININWRLDQAPVAGPPFQPGTVKLSFTNIYRWHPNEPRATQSLHQAAERLKKKGAKEFTMKGEATLRLEYQ